MIKKEKVVRPRSCVAVYPAFRLEIAQGIKGGKRVTVGGCESILAYSHDAVAFRFGKSSLVILGSDLWCRTFGAKCAEVTGKVTNIFFEEKEYVEVAR